MAAWLCGWVVGGWWNRQQQATSNKHKQQTNNKATHRNKQLQVCGSVWCVRALSVCVCVCVCARACGLCACRFLCLCGSCRGHTLSLSGSKQLRTSATCEQMSLKMQQFQARQKVRGATPHSWPLSRVFLRVAPPVCPVLLVTARAASQSRSSDKCLNILNITVHRTFSSAKVLPDSAEEGNSRRDPPAPFGVATKAEISRRHEYVRELPRSMAVLRAFGKLWKREKLRPCGHVLRPGPSEPELVRQFAWMLVACVAVQC